MKKNYELYILLKEKSENQDYDFNSISNTINNIYKDMRKEKCIEHYKEILALILHHQFINQNKDFIKSKLPYKGKIMFGGKGIKFQFKEFPDELKKIISEYIMTYTNKTKA